MAVEERNQRVRHLARWWQGGYFRMDERPTAETELVPKADTLHFYAKDKAGVSHLYYRDDANVEHEVATGGAVITDHGGLTGLADDDHPQYLLASGTRALTGDWTTGAFNVIIGNGATASELRFLEPSGSGTNYTGFKASALAGNVIYTLPTADALVSGYALTSNASGVLSWAAAGVTDHGALTGLLDDDHTQYALLVGRSGGQTLEGDTASGGNLTLSSTHHATKGKVIIAPGFIAPGTVLGSDVWTFLMNTTDGSDTGGIIISGGGSVVSANTRGATIQFYGNEGPYPGQLYLDAGDVTSGDIFLRTFTANVPLNNIVALRTSAVGIGLTPTFIAGASRQLLQVSNASGNGIIALSNAATESENPRIYGGSELFLFAPKTSGTIQFFTNDSLKAIISQSGNIAIGTSSFPSTGNSGLVFGDGTALATMASNTAGLYADDIAGNVSMHAINENGDIIKLIKTGTYTPTNVSADRSYDANATSLDEIADVLGTLIADLQLTGLIV